MVTFSDPVAAPTLSFLLKGTFVEQMAIFVV